MLPYLSNPQPTNSPFAGYKMKMEDFILLIEQNQLIKMSDEKDSYENEDGNETRPKKIFDWMPAGCSPLADGEYDAIILGTGLTECIISGLLSVNGKRVLHLDRNNYYGADTASLSLTNLYKKYRDTATPGDNLGHSRGDLFVTLQLSYISKF